MFTSGFNLWVYPGYSSFQLIRDYLHVKYYKGAYKTLWFVFCVISYYNLIKDCANALMCCIIWNHIGVLFSVYIRYYQRLYTIQVRKCSQKVQDQTYGLILLNFYEDNSPIITRSYFLQIFFFGGDTLYSSSYSEDTNIHVFTHSTSWKDSVLGNFRC